MENIEDTEKLRNAEDTEELENTEDAEGDGEYRAAGEY